MHRPTVRCAVGALVVAVITASIAPMGVAGAADPLPPVADPMGEGGVCADAPTGEPFTDVDAGDLAQPEIACLFHTGITEGTTATTYTPNGTLTRRQMALFLTRTATTADDGDTGDRIAALPAHDGTVAYPDTAAETIEVRIAIGQLSEAGVALGFDDGTYRPRAELSRRQMAKFIARLVEFLTGEDLDVPSGDYFDDDESDSGEVELNQLAELGIFQGDGQGNVRPGDDLTRRQMALILLRMLQVLHADGRIDPLFPTDPGGTTPAPLAPATASATAQGTTVTLLFAESGTPTANSYAIYRILRPGLSCPDFNSQAGRGAYPTTPTATQPDPTPTSDGNTTRTFTDSGLAAQTAYCYAVTTVDDGVESTSAAQAAATTGTLPTITDARAQDGGTGLLVDAGDVHQFVFSGPMAGTVDDPGQLYRLSDGDDTVADIVCGSDVSCVLQPAGTYNGTAYPANQVLRVYINTTPTPTTGGGTPGLAYPATVTNVSAGWDDAGGSALSLTSGDTTLDVAAITPAPPGPDAISPNIAFAQGDESTNEVTLTYSEPVVCDGSAAGSLSQFSRVGASPTVNPTAITCNGTVTVTLTFAPGVLVAGEGWTVRYTDDNAAVDANDVRDVRGNQALSPDNRALAVGA